MPALVLVLVLVLVQVQVLAQAMVRVLVQEMVPLRLKALVQALVQVMVQVMVRAPVSAVRAVDMGTVGQPPLEWFLLDVVPSSYQVRSRGTSVWVAPQHVRPSLTKHPTLVADTR